MLQGESIKIPTGVCTVPKIQSPFLRKGQSTAGELNLHGNGNHMLNLESIFLARETIQTRAFDYTFWQGERWSSLGLAQSRRSRRGRGHAIENLQN